MSDTDILSLAKSPVIRSQLKCLELYGLQIMESTLIRALGDGGLNRLAELHLSSSVSVTDAAVETVSTSWQFLINFSRLFLDCFSLWRSFGCAGPEHVLAAHRSLLPARISSLSRLAEYQLFSVLGNYGYRSAPAYSRSGERRKN